MDTKRVLFFIELLRQETCGHSDEIIHLFQKALDENDDVQKMKLLLNTKEYAYYNETGKSLYYTGKNVLKQIYQNPSLYLDFYPKLEITIESITREIDICTHHLYSPYPIIENINVLKQKDVEATRIVYDRIVNSCIFMVALYEGLAPIRFLSWNSSVGIQEMIKSVNTVFLPLLLEIPNTTRNWIITRHSLGRDALFGGYGFFLSYLSKQEYQKKCGSLTGKRIGGSYSFWNIDVVNDNIDDVPYCWGTGNILSVFPYNAAVYLQPGKMKTERLRCPKKNELEERLPSPFDCVKRLADGAMFCISPDELVLALNRWELGHEITLRKKQRLCLFCGKPLHNDILVCRSHFQV